jgi:hypothetical protein
VFSVGLTTLHHKNELVTKNLTKPRTSTDSLNKRPNRLSSAEVKNDGLMPSIQHRSLQHDAYLLNSKDKFVFLLHEQEIFP